VVHQPRSADVTDIGHRLAALLSERPERRFCHSCLVSASGITYEEIHRAVSLLRTMRRVVVVVGTCSQCRAARVTVQIRDAYAGAGAHGRRTGTASGEGSLETGTA
jgi:hypothetical protein